MGAYLLHIVRTEYCYVGTQVHYGIVCTFGVPVPLCRSEDEVWGHTGSRFSGEVLENIKITACSKKWVLLCWHAGALWHRVHHRCSWSSLQV